MVTNLFEFAQKNNNPQAVEYIENPFYLRHVKSGARSWGSRQPMFCFKTDFQNTSYNPGLNNHMDRLESSEERWDGVPDED